MVLGLRDYVRKNGFPGVVLGLSGGIDSALTAAVAVDALGARPRARRAAAVAVHQRASMDDAAETARLLGMRLDTVPIEGAVDARRSGARRRCSPGGRATSPKRTSRRAPAACC